MSQDLNWSEKKPNAKKVENEKDFSLPTLKKVDKEIIVIDNKFEEEKKVGPPPARLN